MTSNHPPDRGGAPAAQLFALGFLTLFLELILIRFLAGNIWNLGYFPNLVLLAVFVGMGLGFLLHESLTEAKSRSVFRAVPIALPLLGVLIVGLHPAMPGFTGWVGDVGGEVFYTDTGRDAGGIWLFLIWFLSVVGVYFMISQRTAKVFRRFSPLHAYTLDIAGSCGGVIAFMGASFFQLPAGIWFLLLVPLFWLAQEGDGRGRLILPAAAMLAMFALSAYQDAHLLAHHEHNGPLEVHWSPYQKVEYVEHESRQLLFVNGVSHQALEPVTAGSFYQSPYRVRAERGLPSYKRVMVIGAGTGNDVATALANGVEHVDAVEIDPAIAQIGRTHHPGRPYQDPRVTLIVTDARAFMNFTRDRYDLIVFALTDSLVKVSPMAQLRLENYLFTEQAARRAFSLLTDQGDLLFYNYYRLPWVLEKVALMIANGTGRMPQAIGQSRDFAMLLVGRNSAPRSEALRTSGIDPATDDWPFPYLRERGIPPIYAVAVALLAIVVGVLGAILHVTSRRTEGSAGSLHGLPKKLAFLLMGMAFLLLETKGVIQFSLLFGTTWFNNSLVFLAVLVLVLLANWTAQVVRGTWLLYVAYVLLVVFCIVAVYFPLARLLSVEQPLLRFLYAALLTFSPIFFANVIFSLSFRDQVVAEHLFGWNLVGGTFGGGLEYASMAIGYNALAWIVAVAYTIVGALLLIDRAQSHRARVSEPAT